MRATPVEINWHPGLPIFACESYLKAVGDEYGWLGGTDESGQLRCVLPYTVIKKAFFRMVRFRIETIPLGEDLDVRAEKSFLNSIIQHFRSIGADMIIPATNTTLFRTCPDGAAVAPYGTYVIDLSQTEDMLWRDIRSDFQNKIRKAKKIGVQIKSGIEYLDSAYAIIADTLKRSSIRFKSYNEFKRLVLSLGENEKVFVAEYEGVVQGCLVAPFSDHTAYTWYSGRISDSAKGAMHLLRWEAIRQFHRMGVKYFNNTGVRINPDKGSKQEGLSNFKMRFGGKLVQGYMWKYPIHRLKYGTYCFVARYLRGGDIVDRECHKLDGIAL